MKARLKTLLGGNYQDFMDRMAVQTPIEKVDGTIFLHGCMAHACTFEEAAMAITLPDQKLHCATLSKPLDGKPVVKVFNENNTPEPASLKRATLKFLQ